MREYKIRYKSNKNVVYSCKYHVIFCPKYRRKVLIKGVEDRLKTIVTSVCMKNRAELLEIEVMPDHVHILIEVDLQLGVHLVIKRIKGRSSRLLRKDFPFLRSRIPCLWANSYFISTVGGAPLQVIKQYIEEQKNV